MAINNPLIPPIVTMEASRFAQFRCNSKLLRINTYANPSKQRALTLLESVFTRKPGEWTDMVNQVQAGTSLPLFSRGTALFKHFSQVPTDCLFCR